MAWFPGRQISIADAFLRVLAVIKDVPRNLKAITAVFVVRLLNGLFRTGEVKRNDVAVLQNRHLLKSFSVGPYTHQGAKEWKWLHHHKRFFDLFNKIFHCLL